MNRRTERLADLLPGVVADLAARHNTTNGAPMTEQVRADLTGAEKAVSETLDEVNFRMHGLTSSGSYHQQFIDWLAERGYTVVPLEDAA